jgi:TDG/mug DNA glycosylase family protein
MMTISPIPWKPNREQIAAARDRALPDIISPHLEVLFCGINPSLYSAAVGHHFARPGNRFWPALHAGKLTPRLFSPFEDHLLPDLGYGLTTIVPRATARADELGEEELKLGAQALEEKIRQYSPRTLAFLGVSAYRTGFGKPRAALGLQPQRLAGALVWVLPSPSGLNAHYRLADLARLYAELAPVKEEIRP